MSARWGTVPSGSDQGNDAIDREEERAARAARESERRDRIEQGDQNWLRDLATAGFVSLGSRDIPGAKAHYMKAISLARDSGISGSPSLANSFYGLGLCLVEEKNFSQAARAFERALEADPDRETKREIKEELRKIKARR